MNGFTFFKEYYELIKYLDNEDRLLMYDAILKYMFEDEETTFEGLKNGIWINLKRPLLISKNKGKNSKRIIKTKVKSNKNQKEIKLKSNENQIEIKTKSNENRKSSLDTMSMSMSMSMSNIYINNINNKEYIYKLFEEYFELRKKNKYTLNETVVNRLINKLNEYGTTDEDKIEIITNAINGAWKDFYPVKVKKIETKPEWFDKEIKYEKASDEEIKKMEAILKQYR